MAPEILKGLRAKFNPDCSECIHRIYRYDPRTDNPNHELTVDELKQLEALTKTDLERLRLELKQTPRFNFIKPDQTVVCDSLLGWDKDMWPENTVSIEFEDPPICFRFEAKKYEAHSLASS